MKTELYEQRLWCKHSKLKYKKTLEEKITKEPYQPALFAPDTAPDCISLFESVLEQQLSHSHWITIKTTLHARSGNKWHIKDMLYAKEKRD
jgi:hypothetical protein